MLVLDSFRKVILPPPCSNISHIFGLLRPTNPVKGDAFSPFGNQFRDAIVPYGDGRGLLVDLHFDGILMAFCEFHGLERYDYDHLEIYIYIIYTYLHLYKHISMVDDQMDWI